MCNRTSHLAADNRVVQCLQSSICLCHVPLHRPVQFSIIRGMRLVAQMFSPRIAPSPLGIVTPTKRTVPQAKPTHHPKQHLDRFSRFCMGCKCYAVQCNVNREEKNTPKNALLLQISSPYWRMTDPQPQATSIKN